MNTRDEFVEKLKSQLDQWNAEIARWEKKGKDAQAQWQAESAKQLDALRSQREKGLYQLRLLQNASAEAWTEVMRGAEQAWKEMGEAWAKARSHFEKK
jgi:lipid II:glycine glycyltransferase (peptidoglycan interpeptide bridge formation enzyme)